MTSRVVLHRDGFSLPQAMNVLAGQQFAQIATLGTAGGMGLWQSTGGRGHVVIRMARGDVMIRHVHSAKNPGSFSKTARNRVMARM